MSKRKLLVIVVVLSTVILSIRIYKLYFTYGGKFDTDYTFIDLENNFIENEEAFYEFRDYCQSILPVDKTVMFGFAGRSDRFYIKVTPLNEEYYSNPYLWEMRKIKLNKGNIVDIVSELGCSIDEFKELVDKFKKTNCIRFCYPSEPKSLSLEYRYSSYVLNFSMGYEIFNFKKKGSYAGPTAYMYKDNVSFWR